MNAVKISLTLLTLFPHICSAQQYDSTFIAPFEQELSVSASSYYQFTMLTHTADNNISTTYIPNTPVGIGLSVSYKNFSVSGGMRPKFMKNPEFGETKMTDWQWHYNGRKFILDMVIKNYEGFYSQNDNEIITLHPDIKVIQYGLYGQYLFNSKKFSYRAAFSQSERQLKSAGSFQLGGGFSYNYISAETSLAINTQNSLKNYQFGISGGYVYTWVIKKGYHVSTGMSAGLNIGSETVSMEKINVSPNLLPNVSIGYSADSWSVRISCVLNRTYISNNGKLNIFFDTGCAEMSFIKRFDTKEYRTVFAQY